MIITQYDPNSHTAVSASFEELRHLFLLAIFVGTAPVLGPAAYFISRIFGSPDEQGALFIEAWVALLFLTCVIAALVMFIRGVSARRSYERETQAGSGRRVLSCPRF